MVRGRDGSLRAFHNSCRHRGSRVCSADKGSAVRLVCPYHNWSYDLDGRLLFARDMGKGFDPKPLGLKPIHCESVGGYILVLRLAAEAPATSWSFAPRSNLYFAPHHLTEAKVAVFESTIVEQGNWKLVWENNRECYHCAPNQPELCRTFPEAPTISGVDGAMDDPDIAAHWKHCEGVGLPSRFELSADGQYRVTRMPLLRDALSYTMSGKAAVRRPLSDAVAEPNIGSGAGLFHYPNTWNACPERSTRSSFRVKMPTGPDAKRRLRRNGSFIRMRSKASIIRLMNSQRSGSPPTPRIAASSRKTSAGCFRPLSNPGRTILCMRAA